jgi:uncharacterized protein GlcG (DUF336 family)
MTSSESVVRNIQIITYATARLVVDAGIAAATEMGERVSVCVTDPTGGIVAAGRMDGAAASTVDAARGKAFYSARSGRTTEDFIEKRLRHDEVLWKAVSKSQDTFLVPGGFPLLCNGASVGGVGVSGGKYQDDVKVAAAAAAAFDDLAAGD